jgi:hypothetical protein
VLPVPVPEIELKPVKVVGVLPVPPTTPPTTLLLPVSVTASTPVVSVAVSITKRVDFT